MFGTEQLARLETLTCEMSRKLDVTNGLLQQLIDMQRERDDSYTVTISEDQWKEWTGQDD